MKRRNFFKNLGCLIAGIAVAPAIKATEKNDMESFEVYLDYTKPISLGNDRYVVLDQSGNGNHCFYVDCCDSEYVSFPESKENFEPNPEDCRLVLFDANGESYEFPKNI